MYAISSGVTPGVRSEATRTSGKVRSNVDALNSNHPAYTTTRHVLMFNTSGFVMKDILHRINAATEIPSNAARTFM